MQNKPTAQRSTREVGLQITFRPGTETVLVEIRSNDLDRVPVMCPDPDTSDSPENRETKNRW